MVKHQQDRNIICKVPSYERILSNKTRRRQGSLYWSHTQCVEVIHMRLVPLYTQFTSDQSVPLR